MSDKPGKQPTDRQSPVKAEAVGDATVTVEYGGHDYEVARYTDPDDMPGDLVDALDADKPSQILQVVLGREQWAAFKRTKPTLRDYKGLAAAWVDAQGLGDTGE